MTKKLRNYALLLFLLVLMAGTLTACQKTPVDEPNGQQNGQQSEEPGKPYEVFAYIKTFDRDNMTLTYDEAEMITRDQTDRIAELGLNADEDFPNDFYIYNGSTKTVTLFLSKDAEISLVNWKGAGGIEMEDADLDDFSKRINEYSVPYHLTVQDKAVVKIVEQYLP